MKRLFFVLLAITLAVLGAFAQGSTGSTTTTTTQNYVFPPFALIGGDTAAVNLTNIAPAPTAAGATQPSCTGTVTFANSTGTAITKPTSFTVGSGQITTVTQAFTGTNGTREPVVASVQQTTTRPNSTPCSLVFSLQVYDSSGVTHIFMGNTSAAASIVGVLSPAAPAPFR